MHRQALESPHEYEAEAVAKLPRGSEASVQTGWNRFALGLPIQAEKRRVFAMCGQERPQRDYRLCNHECNRSLGDSRSRYLVTA
jgi:hypothetical protein